MPASPAGAWMPIDWVTAAPQSPPCATNRAVRSELAYLLVSLDKNYTAEHPGESWESYYARRIIDHFSPAGAWRRERPSF